MYIQVYIHEDICACVRACMHIYAHKFVHVLLECIQIQPDEHHSKRKSDEQKSVVYEHPHSNTGLRGTTRFEIAPCQCVNMATFESKRWKEKSKQRQWWCLCKILFCSHSPIWIFPSYLNSKCSRRQATAAYNGVWGEMSVQIMLKMRKLAEIQEDKAHVHLFILCSWTGSAWTRTNTNQTMTRIALLVVGDLTATEAYEAKSDLIPIIEHVLSKAANKPFKIQAAIVRCEQSCLFLSEKRKKSNLACRTTRHTESMAPLSCSDPQQMQSLSSGIKQPRAVYGLPRVH